MLADRAGIVLESADGRGGAAGGRRRPICSRSTPGRKRSLRERLRESPEAMDYLEERGLTRESVERFRLGYAPEARGWLLGQARRKRLRHGSAGGGGSGRSAPTAPGSVRERFRGRLIFPIHDDRGGRVGFRRPDSAGGRADAGRARASTSPSTLTAPRRRCFTSGRSSTRRTWRERRPAQAGWVAVVEGYTDVIAAHQVGLANVVGTLGTALGEDHLSGAAAAGRPGRAGLRRRRGGAVGGGSGAGVFPGQRPGSARARPCPPTSTRATSF